MKKKKLIICISLCIAAIIIFAWLLTRPKSLGNMSHSFSKSTTSSSSFSFAGNAGDTIRFEFTSEIENGTLDIMLYDSKGNLIEKLDKAKKLSTFKTLDYTDTYSLYANYNDFIGNFKIKVLLWGNNADK